MLVQLKNLGSVLILEALGVGIFYLLRWFGQSETSALNGVLVLAAATVVGSGLVNASHRDRKAQSNRGAPRISLASDLLVWWGFGTFLAAHLSAHLDGLVAEGGWSMILILVILIFFTVVFAARSLNSEMYHISSRRYLATLVYLPFFALAVIVPTTVAILPIWILIAFGVFQILIIGLTSISLLSAQSEQG